MRPSSQRSIPPSIFSRVVLPAPDGPTMMQNSPLLTWKVMWSAAATRTLPVW